MGDVLVVQSLAAPPRARPQRRSAHERATGVVIRFVVRNVAALHDKLALIDDPHTTTIVRAPAAILLRLLAMTHALPPKARTLGLFSQHTDRSLSHSPPPHVESPRWQSRHATKAQVRMRVE